MSRLFIVLVYVVLILLFVTCCIVDHQTNADKNYFPLQQGNQWIYSAGFNSSYRDTFRVFDVLNNSGYRYFIYGRLNSQWTELLRKDRSGKIFVRLQGKDYLYFDFTLDNGETYKYFERTVTVKSGLTIEIPAGRFEDCIDLFFDLPGFADDEFGFVFAPGVGIVKRYGAWEYAELLLYDLQNNN